MPFITMMIVYNKQLRPFGTIFFLFKFISSLIFVQTKPEWNYDEEFQPISLDITANECQYIQLKPQNLISHWHLNNFLSIFHTWTGITAINTRLLPSFVVTTNSIIMRTKLFVIFIIQSVPSSLFNMNQCCSSFFYFFI